MEGAAALFGRALRVRQRLLGPRAPEVLAAKNTTCLAVTRRADSIDCFREAIALAQTIAGPRHPDLADIKTDLAYRLVDDAATREEACQLATEALDIERTQLEPSYTGVLRAMLTLAQCRRDQGRAAEARRVYLEAIAYADRPSGVRADLLQDFGTFHQMQHDYPQAIVYFRKALADHELVHGPTHHKAIETRQRIALTLTEANRPLEALAELDAAITLCDRAGEMPLTYPELLEAKGSALMSLNKLQPAYEALTRSLALHEKLGTPEVNRATLIWLGEVEARLGKLDQAAAHAQRAMKVWTMDSAPAMHATAALLLAEVVADEGRGGWPRACELARRALFGFTRPFGGSLATYIAETRKFLSAHRCAPGG
jgi:tetratricopeptide (TPR) repeat protein